MFGCTGTQSATTFDVVPPAPVITGDLQFCPGDVGVLDAGFFNNTTYLWSTGATTQTISTTTPGTFSVTATDQYTCTGSNTAVVSLYTPPTPVILGGVLCAGNTATLELGVQYSAYSWSTGETSNSITVNMAQTYSVTVTDANGCTGVDDILVVADALPEKPGPITGPTDAICGATNLVYTIDPVANASHYVWMLPDGVTDVSSVQNTTSLTVNFESDFYGGDIIVAASNDCGQSPSIDPTFITVTITTADNDGDGLCATFDPDDNDPCNPDPNSIACDPCVTFDTIAGNPNFCAGGSTMLDAGAGYSSYLWSTGETTQSITVTTAGVFSVTITGINGCTKSDSFTTNISGVIPDSPGPITPPAGELCNATNVSFSIDPVPNATFYVWKIPEHITIVSGQGTTTLTVDFEPDFLRGDIVVAAANACGQSTTINPTFITVSTTDKDGDGVCVSLDPDDFDGCVPSSTSPACDPCSILDEESFEANFGIWNDGGDNCKRIKSNANTGSYSIRIQDDEGAASSMFTDILDLSASTLVNFQFSFYTESMENDEDFYLEISTDGGASYAIYQEWNSGIEFLNNVRYNESFSVNHPFTSNTRFRFRCDATNNNDQVFIDDIAIEICDISCIVGAPCDDGDDCTTDVYDVNCQCIGTFIDNDGDGVCAADDPDDNDGCIPNINTSACSICPVFITDGYESDFGNWNDGGVDCERTTSNANTGTYSIIIKDDSGAASSMFSDVLDLSAYPEVNFGFSYYTENMEANERFVFEISTDGGSNYSVYREWISGTDFQNNTRFNESFAVTHAFTNNTRFRLRCDGSNNSDQVYIDDVIVSLCFDPPVQLIGNNPDSTDQVPPNVLANGEKDIVVYPIPARDVLNIYSKEISGIVGRILMYDLHGREVLNVTFDRFHPEVIQLPIHHLASGMYFLKLQSGPEKFKIQKVIIVK